MIVESKFDLWALVELFGHARIAGRCTEESIAGTTFLRVDVPETKTEQPITKYYGGSAIYAINPVTEEVARHMAEQLQVKPIDAWDIRKMQDKLLQIQAANPGSQDEFEE